MTFRDPIMLAGLILLPLAALAYVSICGRRRREARTFATPALIPNLVTGRPGWRRHLRRCCCCSRRGARRRARAAQRTVASPSAPRR